MAIRVRLDGTMWCAAHTEARPGDTYIDDALHYEMSVVHAVIVALPMPKHVGNPQWWWASGAPSSVKSEKAMTETGVDRLRAFVSRQGEDGGDLDADDWSICVEALATLSNASATIKGMEAEIERLRAIVAKDPKTVMIAFEDGDHMRLSRAAANERKRAELAEEAENETKDAFWAIYPRYLEMGGDPVSTEVVRTSLAARAEAAEAERDALRILVHDWQGARSAFLALPAGDPATKVALNRLANAEDALARNHGPAPIPVQI